MFALLRMDWTLNRRLLLKASPLFLIFLVAAAAPEQLLGAAFLIAPMVISGVGIQVAISPAWRSGLAWAHGIGSGAFLLAYFVHLAFRGLQPSSLIVMRRQQN